MWLCDRDVGAGGGGGGGSGAPHPNFRLPMWLMLVTDGDRTGPGLGRPVRRHGDLAGDRGNVRSCVGHRS